MYVRATGTTVPVVYVVHLIGHAHAFQTVQYVLHMGPIILSTVLFGTCTYGTVYGQSHVRIRRSQKHIFRKEGPPPFC